MTTTTIFIVEFRHEYFGWLSYDRDFATKEAATNWMNCHPSPYPQRVRQYPPDRVT